MYVDEQHRLAGVAFRASPNFDQRPAGAAIELVVIHCISLPKGVFGSGLPAKLFTNELDFGQHPDLEELRDVNVSAHAIIERNGSVTQFVAFNERAWHAGVSSWQHLENVNDFSIGIELEGTDDTLFEDAQYESLIEVLGALFRRYPTLALSKLVGHSEIAPGRKTDPGSKFDWSRLINSLIERLNAA